MWKKHTIEPNTVYKLTHGKLRVLAKKQDKEWLVKSDLNNEIDEKCEFDKSEEQLDFAECKVYSADKSSSLYILPALPEKPVVVKPEKEFKLLPKTSVQLLISLPVWVQFYHGTVKKDHLIMDTASKVLSKTWLGEPDSGIIAYSLKIKSGEILTSGQAMDNHIMCPVKISNESNTVLDFQRFLLHTDQLTIYLVGDKLFTNNVHVKFKGEGVISDLHFSSHKPDSLENAKKVAEPRNPEKIGALKRSFFFIKSLTQY
jgi:hypothetical protein